MFVTYIDFFFFFTAAAGHNLTWKSGRLSHESHCRGDICIQGCQMYSRCARDRQSPYFARISVRGFLQELNSQAVPENQDLGIGCALLRSWITSLPSLQPMRAQELAFLSAQSRWEGPPEYRAAGLPRLSRDRLPPTRVPEGGARPSRLPARLTAGSLR